MYANRQRFNIHGLKQLTKSVEIPDYHLMVGTAECLDGLPVISYNYFIPESVAKTLPATKMSWEEAQENLRAGKLTVDDFIDNKYYLGDALDRT